MSIDALFSTSFHLATQVLLNIHPVNHAALPAPHPKRTYMLYAHVPFCESLCPYCSFNRFIYQEPLARAYFSNLRDEMRMVKRKGYNFSTLYIGGGTPTILLDELSQTIDLARSLFDIHEVSCETNPNHLDQRLVDALGDRVQRLSVGVQSFDNDLLRKVNRLDRFGTGKEILARLQKIAGAFHSLNVDMIFNFPSQDADMIRRDVEAIIACGANQTTFYPLMTAPSVSRALSASVGQIEHSSEADYYEQIVQALSGNFELSTAWTFSRTGGGLIDEYIVESEEYVGIGSGSFSYLNGSLYVNTFSLEAYRDLINARKSPITGKRRFARLDQMRYRFMMELFGLKLDKAAWMHTFGRPVERSLPLEIAFFQANNAFEQNTPHEITLSPRGRYLLVVMMREFFSGINRIRDQARQAVIEENNGKERSLRPYPQANA
jgi:menaquinone C8-methyltransferase